MEITLRVDLKIVNKFCSLTFKSFLFKMIGKKLLVQNLWG